MKQTNLLKTFLLLCALVVGSTCAWADEATFDFTNIDGFSSWSTSYSEHSVTYADATVIFASANRQGSTITNQPVTKGQPVSIVMNDGFTISDVSFTCTQWGSKAQTITLHYSTDGGENYTSTGVTSTNFTISSNELPSGTNAVKITFSSTSNQVGIASASITYSSGGATTPSISADNVNITYDATGGSIGYTLQNGTGNVTAATTSDWLTLGTVTSSAVPFTCSANPSATARTAEVTLSFAGATDKVVTVTQAADPNAVNNISDVTEVGTAYTVKGTVVATNARGFVIGDGTGYVYTYLNSAPTQSINDKVSISGTTGSYGHIIQFTSSATIATTATSNYDGTPAATAITEVPDYSTGNHLSTYLEFEGTLTKSSSNYLITVGESQIQISYPTSAQETALTYLVGKTVHVKGYFTGINSSSKFTVMLESVAEVAVSTVAVTPSALTGFTYEVNNGPSEAKTFTVSGANLTANISLSLGESNYEMSLTEGSGYTNSLTLTQTAGAVAETTVYVRLKAGLAVNASYVGTITLESTGVDNKSVSLAGSVTAPEAANFTWDLTTDSYDEITDPDIVTWSSSYATMTNSSKSGGTSASNYLGGDSNNRTSSRIYSSNTLTITPASGYAITSIVFTATSSNYANALQSSTWSNASAAVDDKTVTVTPATGYASISATIGGTCGLTAVKVYYEEVVSIPVAISAAGLATFASNHALDFTSVDGIEAYIAKENGSKIELEKVNKVPAGAGVLLRSVSGAAKAADVPVATTADAVTGNLFVRGTGAAVESGSGPYNYVLGKHEGKVGFYKAGGMTVATDKAYLQTTVAAARIDIDFDGDVTAIETVKAEKANNEYYNLAGQRVAQPTKGLYIVNGRKVVVK
jgi:hypothetical protein